MAQGTGRRAAALRSESNCTEGNYNIAIGSDVYLLSGDGLLMPIKKEQPPLALRYFKPAPK
jgi:hypothetical protein